MGMGVDVWLSACLHTNCVIVGLECPKFSFLALLPSPSLPCKGGPPQERVASPR